MAAWIPFVKAAIPFITQVLTGSIPVFTAKSAAGKSDELFAKQIAELQEAVTHNAESVKALAVQLKDTLEKIDDAAVELERRLVLQQRIAVVALSLAGISVAVALWALVKT